MTIIVPMLYVLFFTAFVYAICLFFSMVRACFNSGKVAGSFWQRTLNDKKPLHVGAILCIVFSCLGVADIVIVLVDNSMFGNLFSTDMTDYYTGSILGYICMFITGIKLKKRNTDTSEDTETVPAIESDESIAAEKSASNSAVDCSNEGTSNTLDCSNPQSESNNYCRKCGHKLAPDSIFCSNCGTHV